MKVNVAIIGAGSVNWMRNIMRDFFQIEEFEGGTLRLVDPKKEYVAAVREMLLNFCRLKKKDFRVDIFEDRREALAGADFVVCTFSPGSMDAFWYDLELPNIYGINLPVSMTVGIPGISAAIRTVPVAEEIVQDMEAVCPGAWLLSVTNPMTAVTTAYNRAAKTVKVVGMCHEIHALPSYLGPMLNLPRPEDMDIMTYLYKYLPEQGLDFTVAGINHFIWLTRATLKGEDMLPVIREYCATHTECHADTIHHGFSENPLINHGAAKLAMCRQFGYLPLAGDRHQVEFWPSLCNPRNGWGRKYGVDKTTVDSRRAGLEVSLATVRRYAAATEETMEWGQSGEEMCAIMRGILTGTPVRSIVNMPNQGQIGNLPRGAVVETFGTITKDGIEPALSGDMPGAIGSLCRLHLDVIDMVVRAALTGDRRLLVEAMTLDPSSANADFEDIPKLCDQLLEANRQYLPRFFR